MENLIKENYLNPFIAVTDNGNMFYLDNIIIYCENGELIETNRGWFGARNNDLEDLEILNGIKRKRKIDFSTRENFIVKSEEKEWRNESRYTLYLYYKNINYKYLGLKLDGLFLNIKYNILNNYNFEMVVGDRNKKSSEIKYSKEVEENIKEINSYNFDCHNEVFLKALKKLEKMQKKFYILKEFEKTLTEKDWEQLARAENIKHITNNKSLESEV